MNGASEKLALRILLATGVTAILSALFFFAYDVVSYRSFLREELDRQTTMMAGQVRAALDFGDVPGAETILDDLVSAENVRAVTLCGPTGDVVIALPTDGDGRRHCAAEPPEPSAVRRIESHERYRLVVIGRTDLLANRALRIAGFVLVFIIISISLAVFATRHVRTAITTLFAKQRETEKRLMEARERAEVAARTKASFLANMSHEIRTPLNGMIGSVELLGGSNLDSTQEGLVRILESSGRALLNVVNDVLEISRLESGRFELNPEPVEIRALLASTVQLFETVSTTRQLSFRTVIGEDVPMHLVIDGHRLRQVLSNLVSNAVKFTSAGTITVRLDRVDDTTFRIEVEDQGIGIPADRLAKIFSRFEQADASTTRAYGGTGLGLAIAQEIVRAMGGRIEARSVEGKGSTFSLSITAEQHEPTDASRHPPKNADSRRRLDLSVLLCEDNPVNATIARRMLERMGCQVVHAKNGVEAVDFVAATDELDVILMDCQMPIMDGYQASRVITRRPDAPPIVALTANVMEADIERCRAAGMVDWTGKPVTMQALADLLERTMLLGADGKESARSLDLEGEDTFTGERVDNHIVDASVR